MKASATQRPGFTLIELLVVIAIIAILIALLVPAVQKVREAAARTQCQNNMKQLVLGLHNYHDVNKGFPPARWVSVPNSNPAIVHSWISLTLPFIEQDAIYKQFNFKASWDDPPNVDVIKHQLSVLLCPSAPANRNPQNRGKTDYSATTAVTRPNSFVTTMPPNDNSYLGVLGNNVKRAMTDIIDGTSNTLLIAECAGRNQRWEMGKFISAGGSSGGPWANPNNRITITGYNTSNNSVPGACAVNCTNVNEMYAFHTAIANAGFADGSVRSVRAGLDVNIAIRLMTRNQSEVVPSNSYE